MISFGIDPGIRRMNAGDQKIFFKNRDYQLCRLNPDTLVVDTIIKEKINAFRLGNDTVYYNVPDSHTSSVAALKAD